MKTSFVCMQKNPTVKALCGSGKPICSNRYWEQFQVDLIDLQKMQKQDPFGVLMKWIVMVKDHATSFTHVLAIPGKTAHLLHNVFKKALGGKEFPACVILQFL